MSGTSTVVSAELYEYIAARTHAEDAFLQDLKRAAVDADIPAIWISPEQGAFIEVLLRSVQASVVVEVGTLAGYSAICMARALPAEGKVISIEVSGKHADFAREWVARSDVNGRIEVRHGRGSDLLPRMPGESVDAVFLDADKESYALYLDEARRILRPGGLLLVDNAFAFGKLLDMDCDDPSVVAIREFNEILASDTEFDGVIVPLGDGLWVSRRVE